MYDHGKLANRTLAGRLYKNGQAFNDWQAKRYYTGGKKFNGQMGGKLYRDGQRFSGSYKGILYNNGGVKTGDVGATYYAKGRKVNGKMTVGQTTYLFHNGTKQKGVQKVNGTYYMFNLNSGAMVKNKYVKSQWGNYYFFGADGKIGTDVVRMNGTYYYFDHKTYLMHKNTYDKSRWGTWYMFGGDGKVFSGYKYWYGQLYYFKPGTYEKATNQYAYENGNRYWADKNGVVTSGNAQIETAIATGSTIIGKSPYNWGGGRTPQSIALRQFDCSSFVHWAYASAGVELGDYRTAVTYSEVNLGRGINWNNIKRGDIFFMDNVDHVGIYLGGGYFLHDSPNSPTGGVGVSNLDDVVDRWNLVYKDSWRNISDDIVRRVVG